MVTYEQLLIEADENSLVAKEKNLPISKGRIKGNRIAIQRNLHEREKKCIMAEELGHYYTAVGNILDQSTVSNRKQELRGWAYAYNRLVGLVGIVNAYRHRCQSLSEMAEYLEVTEEFLMDSLKYYKAKYGCCAKMDNYVIFFEPSLAVLEMV
ncbi:MAG: hypothetical protein K2N63_05065 [Lachnospiraceae bacterium]|nr:hypothetical protein [Lachnospiraceae bacterium]